MELKGSRTEANLLAAFAGESQARNKYSYYASKAKKDGYVQIANIFEQTANNEKEHAKLWFKYLHGGAVPSTAENLKDAAAGENYEWTDMYDGFAKTGTEEQTNRRVINHTLDAVALIIVRCKLHQSKTSLKNSFTASIPKSTRTSAPRFSSSLLCHF